MASTADIIVWALVAGSVLFVVGLAVATEIISRLHWKHIEKRERDASRRRRRL